MSHKKVSLPKMIKGFDWIFDLHYSSIKYDKYLVLQPQGVQHKSKHPTESVCLKFIVTLHHQNGNSYLYQFSNYEIATLLSGNSVTKKSRGRLIDFTFQPFIKYDNQTRPTTGKLIAEISMQDPQEREAWESWVDNAQYDQGVDGGLLS